MQNPDRRIHHFPYLYWDRRHISPQQFLAIAKTFINGCQTGAGTDISDIDSRKVPFQLKITPISCVLAQTPK